MVKRSTFGDKGWMTGQKTLKNLLQWLPLNVITWGQRESNNKNIIGKTKKCVGNVMR
jgi:hypothetical protein